LIDVERLPRIPDLHVSPLSELEAVHHAREWAGPTYRPGTLHRASVPGPERRSGQGPRAQGVRALGRRALGTSKARQ
jgi:hypothetical protein